MNEAINNSHHSYESMKFIDKKMAINDKKLAKYSKIN